MPRYSFYEDILERARQKLSADDRDNISMAAQERVIRAQMEATIEMFGLSGNALVEIPDFCVIEERTRSGTVPGELTEDGQPIDYTVKVASIRQSKTFKDALNNRDEGRQQLIAKMGKDETEKFLAE